MNPTCWLIGDGNGRFPVAAAQFATLRRLRVERHPVADDIARASARPALIAIDLEAFEGLGESRKRRLGDLVEQGAIAYLRGGAARGEFSLAPFAEGFVRVAAEDQAGGYFLARHPTVPPELHGEAADCDLKLPGAEAPDDRLAGVLFARHRDGRQRPVIFVLQSGAGQVIYDLQDEVSTAHLDLPIVQRLADPALRCGDIGALLAVERACGRNGARRSAVNLTIDDRPANHDYLNTARLRRLLEHLAARLPGFHGDFGWTPAHCHPSRGYVEVLKQFRAGFVWHGLHRHVDHRSIERPDIEFAAGERLVEAIRRRFDVRFQPVMIFPFEGVNRASIELLKAQRFVAISETPGADPEREQSVPPYLRYSTFEPDPSGDKFAVLYRYHATRFKRDLMFAHLALGLPIIAMAHPAEIGLKRFARLRSQNVEVSYFDHILDFAVEKKLPPRSLEEIARDLTAG